VVKPFTAAKDSKLCLSVNGYQKELTMPQDVTFTAGKIKTLNFKYDKAPTPHVTWDLTKESYESASADKVVWSSDFVDLTLEKGTSSTPANNHLADEHSRVYKDQIMTFDPLGKYKIESIEFAVVSGYDDEFAKATWVNGEPVTSGNTVVVTPTDGHAKVSATLGAATRFTSITVYYSYDENYVLPTVESIAVDGQISELMQGSEFVFGGTVTATYTNGETTDVTSVAQFSGYDMSTPGEQSVEVSYTDIPALTCES
jgi:flagellar hook protein FlgE